MFLDDPAGGEPLFCTGCGQVLTEPPSFVKGSPVAGQDGPYHERCAKPILSVLRAYHAMGSAWGC